MDTHEDGGTLHPSDRLALKDGNHERGSRRGVASGNRGWRDEWEERMT